MNFTRILRSPLAYKKGSCRLNLYQILFSLWIQHRKRIVGTELTPLVEKVKSHLQEWAISSYGVGTLFQFFPGHPAEKKQLCAKPTSSPEWSFWAALGSCLASFSPQSCKGTAVCCRLYMKGMVHWAFVRACYRIRKPLEITHFELV